jgi:hypothetical protein
MRTRQGIETLSIEELNRVAGGYYDDWDWCGTRVPGKLPIPGPGDPWVRFDVGVGTLDAVALNPQPLPPKAGLGF